LGSINHQYFGGSLLFLLSYALKSKQHQRIINKPLKDFFGDD
jgi:hypothetical protein